jgi:hypothetical protein
MLAINFLRFAAFLYALDVESRPQSGRNLRLRYPYGSPPPVPPNAPPGHWVWVGPDPPEVEATPDPVPEPVAEYETGSEVIEESEQVAEEELTETVSDEEGSRVEDEEEYAIEVPAVEENADEELTETVSEQEESKEEYDEQEVIEEPAVEEYVLNGGDKEETAVEETATEGAIYSTQVAAGATLMAESATVEGNSLSTGAIVGAVIAVAAVVALALVALGRRRKSNEEYGREWEREVKLEVEIDSESRYVDDYDDDDDDDFVPPPPPPLPAEAWYQDNYVPDDGFNRERRSEVEIDSESRYVDDYDDDDDDDDFVPPPPPPLPADYERMEVEL